MYQVLLFRFGRHLRKGSMACNLLLTAKNTTTKRRRKMIIAAKITKRIQGASDSGADVAGAKQRARNEREKSE